jgi:hypothetical protein
LRSLPIPLLTYTAYDIFLDISLLEDESVKLEKLSTIILSLSPIKIYSLGLLLELLYELQLNSSVNKMNPKNLAIVFGNNILKSNELDQSKLMKDQTKITNLTESLILLFPKLKPVFFENKAITNTGTVERTMKKVPSLSNQSMSTSSPSPNNNKVGTIKRAKPLPTLPPVSTPQKTPSKPPNHPPPSIPPLKNTTTLTSPLPTTSPRKEVPTTPKDKLEKSQSEKKMVVGQFNTISSSNSFQNAKNQFMNEQSKTPPKEKKRVGSEKKITPSPSEPKFSVFIDDDEHELTLKDIKNRLPPGWDVYPTDEGDDIYFYHISTQESHWDTPDGFHTVDL